MSYLIPAKHNIRITFHIQIVREQPVLIVRDDHERLPVLVVVEKSANGLVLCELITRSLCMQLTAARVNSLSLASSDESSKQESVKERDMSK